MEQKILQNESLDQRIETLKTSAEKVEKFSFARELTDAELQEKRKDVTEALIRIGKAKEQLALAREACKAEVKPLEKEYAKTLNQISTGMEEVNEEVYLLKDLESMRMGYYSKEGKLVFSRALKQEEMQYSIADYSNQIKKAN